MLFGLSINFLTIYNFDKFYITICNYGLKFETLIKKYSTMKTLILKIIINYLLICFPVVVFAQWLPLGNSINGAFAYDQSGYAVSLSANGNFIAVGSPYNDTNGGSSGYVRVFEFVDNTWELKGSPIVGDFSGDYFGFSVSISDNGNTVAVGAPESNENGFESGHVRVFHFVEDAWEQLGNTITGSALSDHAGWSVCLNGDGNRLVVGAPDAYIEAGVGSNHGEIRVFELKGLNWELIGTFIGDQPEDNLGYTVSLNIDGTIVAMGSREFNSGAGQVKIFKYENNTWEQIGTNLIGINSNDKFGGAISLNSLGDIIAIGAEDFDGHGQVRIYKNQGNNWVQLGDALNGTAVAGKFGISVSLNDSGTILAVGDTKNNAAFSEAGQVKLYIYENNNWALIENSINGEATGDRLGNSVSLNSDGSIVAVGAYFASPNGAANSGQATVLNNVNVLNTLNNTNEKNIMVYPNPVSDYLKIRFNTNKKQTLIKLYSIFGQLIGEKSVVNAKDITLNTNNLDHGIYLLVVNANGKTQTFKLVKN